ncbi:DUF58 domain-containing protein [Bacillus sp. AFS017336]|uniref:DUF58 domain-containing protein n=1 Tax=Bacillus sp. AFS017336 TaxID=2033489 RepID=UPI000BF0E484|nr:DUF58 domain-containing protein [Bacillus sp. AFS017336]PEK98898.1 hypothetical protein CN601_24720 [Bacillus sp. AFS017336]
MKKSYHCHFLAQPITIVFSVCLTTLFSIFSHTVYYLAICFVHLILVLYARYYARKCVVNWEVKLKQDHLFTDEETDCVITFQNLTFRTIYEISFQFASDESLQWEHESFVQNKFKTNHYVIPFSMKGRENKAFSFKTRALKRGKFNWQDANLVVKDPLRLVTINFSNQQTPIFHVYPNMRKVHIPENKEFQGQRKALVSPLYDETKLIGVKRYESEDFRSIHWGATAKSGELMAKKYAFTQSDRYAIFVNLADQKGFSFHHKSDELIELAIGTCKQLIQQNCSFEIWINRETPKGLTHLPTGKNRKQLQAALNLFSYINDGDSPISSDAFYRCGFRNKILDATPIVIGIPPRELSRKNQWIQITG